MKKIFAFILAALMAVTVLASCGNNKDAKSSSSSKSDAKKTFTVGFDAEFPPYGYRIPRTTSSTRAQSTVSGTASQSTAVRTITPGLRLM